MKRNRFELAEARVLEMVATAERTRGELRYYAQRNLTGPECRALLDRLVSEGRLSRREGLSATYPGGPKTIPSVFYRAAVAAGEGVADAPP